MRNLLNYETMSAFMENEEIVGGALCITSVEPGVGYIKETGKSCYNYVRPYDVLVKNDEVVWHRLKPSDFVIGKKIKVLWTYFPSEDLPEPEVWVCKYVSTYLGNGFQREDSDAWTIAFDPDNPTVLLTYGKQA